jgi:hypothetical protein
VKVTHEEMTNKNKISDKKVFLQHAKKAIAKIEIERKK